MAEQKFLVTDGNRRMLVTASQFARMKATRPASMPLLTVVNPDTKIDSVYINQDGQSVRGMLSPDQVGRRAETGEDVPITGPDDPKLQAHLRQEKASQVRSIADDANVTAFTNAALPASQFIQNAIVGRDAAAIARGELNAANPLATAGGNIAEFLAAGAAGKALVGAAGGLVLGAERAAKVGNLLGVTKASGVLKKTGHILAEDAAIGTHFYTQQLLDTNQPFVAEDAAQQIAVGMLFASPFIAGAAVRAGARAVVGAVGPSVLGFAGNAFTLGAIASKPGSRAAQVGARRAAGTKMFSKLFRRGKGKGLGATDEMAEQQARHLDEVDAVDEFTPEKMRRATPSKRRNAVDNMKAMGDENMEHLDEIQYDTIHTRTNRMSSSVNTIRREALSVNRKMGGTGHTVKLTRAREEAVIAKGNELIGHMGEAGMEEAANAVRRGILKTAKLDGREAHRAIFQARIEARFKRGISGGADIVDDNLRAFSEDAGVWGASQARKNKIINDGIDEVVDAWDKLGEVHIPKNLEDIELLDATRLTGLTDDLGKLRAGMEKLEEAGMLTRGQVRAMETKFIDSGEAIFEGTRAYGDAAKINRARNGAAGRLRKKGEVMFDIPTTPETFAAQKAAMVSETVSDMARLGTRMFDALTSHKVQVAGVRGIAALHSMEEQDRRQLFGQVQQEISLMTGNPMYAMDQMAPILDRAAAAEPQFADLVGQKMTNSLYWLAQELPPPDETVYGRNLPQPLSKIDEFLEKYVAAYDPISVGHAAIEGRATRGMVDAIRVTAPSMYAELNVMVAEALAKAPGATSNPKVVTGLSLFLGNVDPMYTGEFLSRIQSNYAQTTTQDQVINGASSGGPNNQPLRNKSTTTTSQRQQTF